MLISFLSEQIDAIVQPGDEGAPRPPPLPVRRHVPVAREEEPAAPLLAVRTPFDPQAGAAALPAVVIDAERHVSLSPSPTMAGPLPRILA